MRQRDWERSDAVQTRAFSFLFFFFVFLLTHPMLHAGLPIGDRVVFIDEFVQCDEMVELYHYEALNAMASPGAAGPPGSGNAGVGASGPMSPPLLSKRTAPNLSKGSAGGGAVSDSVENLDRLRVEGEAGPEVCLSVVCVGLS